MTVRRSETKRATSASPRTAPASPQPAAGAQGKQQRVTELLRQVRTEAEALSASADRLLARIA